MAAPERPDLERNLAQRVNVGDALTRSAAARPGRLAVVDGERRLTYAELAGARTSTSWLSRRRRSPKLRRATYAMAPMPEAQIRACLDGFGCDFAVYDVEPAIAEVVVVGLPHQRWSEAITAVVVAEPGADLDPEALRAALRERLDGYKVPKSVIVVDELPRTSTGKVQKNVVRERHADHYGGG